MAQKERIYNLHEILAELKQSHGLPEQLSTEAQLWDEILKKTAASRLTNRKAAALFSYTD